MEFHTETCVCEDCAKAADALTFNEKTYKQHFTACYNYHGLVRNALLRLKFARCVDYARPMARIMAQTLAKQKGLSKFDIIVPVPISKLRSRGRGYNQAELMAKYLSKGIGVPYNSRIILKNKETAAQSTLSADQRRNNLSGAYKLTDDVTVRGKSVLIVDDILTTGATIREITKILRQGGARDVYAVVFAYTPPKQESDQ